MGKWENIPFHEVVCFQEGPGVRTSQYTEMGVKLLNVANLQDGKIDLSTSTRHISNHEAYGKYKHFLVDAGDFVIASSGIQVDYFDKKMGFVEESHLPLCMNTSTIRFKAKDDKRLIMRYFMYFLKTPQFKYQLNRFLTGSAQLNFGPSHLKKMYITLPKLDIQQKIANVLDKASALIEMRKAQIEKLDLLIKSQFVEMFGDPVTNPKGWEEKRLHEVCLKITDGTHQSPCFISSGVPFLFVSNIVNNKLIYKTEKYISIETYHELIKRTPIEMGDILLTTVGSYGNPAIVLSDEKFCFQRHIAYLKPNRFLIDSWFVHNAFLSDYVKRQIERLVRGIAQKTLNLKELSEIKIQVPPISLQNDFAVFARRIEFQKELYQKSLDELVKNYNSLLQKCFGGEIF